MALILKKQVDKMSVFCWINVHFQSGSIYPQEFGIQIPVKFGSNAGRPVLGLRGARLVSKVPGKLGCACVVSGYSVLVARGGVSFMKNVQHNIYLIWQSCTLEGTSL